MSPRYPENSRTNSPLLRVFATIGLLAALAVSAPAASSSPDSELVWPKPPAAARVRFLKSVYGPSEWGVSRGFFERIVAQITGDRDLRLVRPTGVAQRNGTMYVADPGAQALLIFDSRRNRAITVERLGADKLVSPVALTLGPEGTVFLVDSWLRAVYTLDADGRLIRKLVSANLDRPAAVAYDQEARRLYIADSQAHRVNVYTPDGTLVQTIGRNGRQAGEFNAPTHLAVAEDGTLLVTDSLNYRIQAFDRSGHHLWQLGKVGDGAGDFAAPKGVAADNAGHLIVVDALFGALQIFRTDGQLLLGFGGNGSRAGEFSLPNGLFIDPDDRVYVADSYNRRIQIFQRIGMTPGAAP